MLRQIIEILAKLLFKDTSLRQKHRKILDHLTCQRSHGSKKAKFTVATSNSKNMGVQDRNGNDVDTPHDMFMGDDFYSDVCQKERLEQAAAASFAAIFVALGHSDLTKRQDPVSWDKFPEMMVD